MGRLIVVAAVVISTVLWHSASFARPAPSRPVELSEEQARTVLSKISLPLQGLKYRLIRARAHPGTDELRKVRIQVLTDYYEQNSKYQRFFEIWCSWENPALVESLSCEPPSQIVELIGGSSNLWINLGRDGGPQVSVDEAIQIGTFLHSRPSYGKDSLPLVTTLMLLRATADGYEAHVLYGSCSGKIDVLKRFDGSFSIKKVWPGACV